MLKFKKKCVVCTPFTYLWSIKSEQNLVDIKTFLYKWAQGKYKIESVLYIMLQNVDKMVYVSDGQMF